MQLSLLPLLYGLDIETDTTIDGLDPSVAAIIAVSVSSDDGVMTFRGPERALLRSLDRWLKAQPRGVVVTWNGSGFDLPFLVERAAAQRVRLGLELRPDPSLPHKHAPLRGHESPYRATWHRHLHLDACCLYRTLLPEGTSGALKSVARGAGLFVVEEDRTRLHELSVGSLVRYAASDADLTRRLASLAWLDAGALVA